MAGKQSALIFIFRIKDKPVLLITEVLPLPGVRLFLCPYL